MDLIPNRLNTMWIDPQEPGLYLGQCAQYCGTQHAKMLCAFMLSRRRISLRGSSSSRKPADQDLSGDPAAAEGQTVFMHSACINCHTVAGTVATGRFGPDLTHVESRDTIASGPVQNTPENLK